MGKKRAVARSNTAGRNITGGDLDARPPFQTGGVPPMARRGAWLRPPFIALILGFGLIVLVIRAWKNRPAPALADGLRPVRGAELDQFRDQARRETDL